MLNVVVKGETEVNADRRDAECGCQGGGVVRADRR